jgi:hypothetical protein
MRTYHDRAGTASSEITARSTDQEHQDKHAYDGQSDGTGLALLERLADVDATTRLSTSPRA